MKAIKITTLVLRENQRNRFEKGDWSYRQKHPYTASIRKYHSNLHWRGNRDFDGDCFAFIASLILSKVVALGWVFTISPKSILLGLSVAGFVGIVFGIYPAWAVSQKSPIEALRYE